MARVMHRRRTGLNEQADGPRIQPKAVLRGTLYAFVLSFAFFVIASLLITYTSLSDSYIPLIATFAGVFSVVWGGLTAGRNSIRGPLINGALVGLLYGLAVLGLGILVLSEPLGAQVFWRVGGAIVCGAVGGLIAPQPKIRKRR